MNEEPNRPNETKEQLSPVVWLVCAFIPSLMAIACLSMRNSPSWLGFWLVVANAGCSLAAGIGLLSGIKMQVVRIIIGMLLAGFFFVLNVFIVVFAGCSGMGGRFAP